MESKKLNEEKEKKQIVGDLLRRDQFAQSFNLPLSEALARDIGPADCQPPLHLQKTSKIFTKNTPVSTPKTQKNMCYVSKIAKLVVIFVLLRNWVSKQMIRQLRYECDRGCERDNDPFRFKMFEWKRRRIMQQFLRAF